MDVPVEDATEGVEQGERDEDLGQETVDQPESSEARTKEGSPRRLRSRTVARQIKQIDGLISLLSGKN